MTDFQNPSHIHFGRGCLSRLPSVLGDRSCILITTAGMIRRGVADRVGMLCGDRVRAKYAAPPYPTVASIALAVNELEQTSADVILAVGGGSVLDTAKAIAALRHPGLSKDWLGAHLREGAAIPSPFCPPAIIAVPTTAGTGSEVTMWGTIWDEDTGRKYSVSHPALLPKEALLDPELTVTVPDDITVASGLDALSHAMEAIWNQNSNPMSDVLASYAISQIALNLRQVLRTPRDVRVREVLLNASTAAGLAFSNTRTALAHSISYPLTGRLRMPHGIACSFTLPEIMKLNDREGGERIALIVRALGCKTSPEAVEAVQRLFDDVGAPRYFARYLRSEAEIENFQGEFITPGRAENNLTPVSQGLARQIFRESAKRMLACTFARK